MLNVTSLEGTGQSLSDELDLVLEEQAGDGKRITRLIKWKEPTEKITDS
jgi:hypothetical protein